MHSQSLNWCAVYNVQHTIVHVYTAVTVCNVSIFSTRLQYLAWLPIMVSVIR